MEDRKSFIFQYCLAILIRLWLFHSEYKQKISDFIALSTPLNSWKRVVEGGYLLDMGVNPYQGDLIHEPPVYLYLYRYMNHYLKTYLPIIFITCDLVISILLYKTTKDYLEVLFLKQKQNKFEQNSIIDPSKLMPLYLRLSDIRISPKHTLLAYLFNPYVIFNCVSMTTTTFFNLFLALYLYGLVHGNMLLSVISLSFCTVDSLYPAMLLLPIILMYDETKHSRTIFIITLFSSIIFGLTYASYVISGSCDFIENIYGFVLNVPDLRPNIGLFWYFFTEMFEHFRMLFISSFQINVSILYLVPLGIRFRRDPMFLACSLLLLTAIFKSYPSLGDVGFCMALLPVWSHLFSYLQQGFLVGCCFLIVSVLGPIVWYLWIYSRSANSNFYFGVTLAFATAQIFLITDLLFAYIKREFWLKNTDLKITSRNVKLMLE